MANLVKGRSLIDAWKKSIQLFTKKNSVQRRDSSIGSCLEIEDLVLHINKTSLSPKDKLFIPDFLNPMIIDFSKKIRVQEKMSISSANARIFNWNTSKNELINQKDIIVEKLRRSPTTRHSIIAFWNPEIDLFTTTPVSPLVAYFRIKDRKLNLSVIARSVDAWTGGLPIFIAFLKLQEDIADELGLLYGTFTSTSFSYHIYLIDLPIAIAKTS